uniref:Uncharacterized protein n=1 Tax=Pristionchus pacificus TaxID=54126 RepID=A0A2A6B564_PRIPA
MEFCRMAHCQEYSWIDDPATSTGSVAHQGGLWLTRWVGTGEELNQLNQNLSLRGRVSFEKLNAHCDELANKTTTHAPANPTTVQPK